MIASSQRTTDSQTTRERAMKDQTAERPAAVGAQLAQGAKVRRATGRTDSPSSGGWRVHWGRVAVTDESGGLRNDLVRASVGSDQNGEADDD